jgi:outer membrane lipoprotein-sorting protein
MRLTRCLMVILALAPAACTLAQSAPATQPAVDGVLDALDQRGKTLRDFSADITQTTEDDMGFDTTSVGHVWFQNASGDQDARVRATFDKKTVGNTTSPWKREFLLDAGWLWDRDYQHKTQIRRQVLRPGQKANLLSLDGPFPLPIGQDKADVHKSFDVQELPPAKSDPPDTVHLQLTPKPGTPLARKFATIDLWMDNPSDMPIRVQTFDAQKTNTVTTTFGNLKINQGLAPGQFKLPEITGWNETDEPYQN